MGRSVRKIGIVLLVEVLCLVGITFYIKAKCQKNKDVQYCDHITKTKIMDDMKCFPIPVRFRDEVTYIDSYGDARANGMHEGCDIMDVQNEKGRIPIVSATDGVVTNIGWLFLGGYRIGITSANDIYYYYAHLDSYAKGIESGKEVKAGQLLGFMGNTGEGEEGTIDQFDVHLHFGIYQMNAEQVEESINAYPFLLQLQ